MNLKPFVLRLALVFAALTACGCEGYYSAYPGTDLTMEEALIMALQAQLRLPLATDLYMLAAPVTGVRRRLLCLEAGSLGMAAWSASLDPRPLCGARILGHAKSKIE